MVIDVSIRGDHFRAEGFEPGSEADDDLLRDLFTQWLAAVAVPDAAIEAAAAQLNTQTQALENAVKAGTPSGG